MNEHDDKHKYEGNNRKRPFVVKLLYRLFMITAFVSFAGMFVFFFVDTYNFQIPFLVAFVISIAGLGIISVIDFITHIIKNSDYIKETIKEDFKKYKEQAGWGAKAAKEEYKDSLDPYARAKVEEMEWKDRPRKIRQNIAGILVVIGVLAGIIGAVIIKDPSKPLFWICFGGVFVVIIVYGIFISGFLSAKKGLKFKNETTAEGVVHNCRLVLSSTTQIGNRVKYKERYEVLIGIDNAENFLRGHYNRSLKIGDKVLVAYDSENPKMCKIIKKISGN